jgi:hypothetical protein
MLPRKFAHWVRQSFAGIDDFIAVLISATISKYTGAASLTHPQLASRVAEEQ